MRHVLVKYNSCNFIAFIVVLIVATLLRLWKLVCMEIALSGSNFERHQRVDRFGVIASILCAIHCAVTPILLIMLPAFGKAWAHPATHWGMAIIVIPIAVYMMFKGYEKHARRRVLYIGGMGVVFIVVGAFLPYMEGESGMDRVNSSMLVESRLVGSVNEVSHESRAGG